MALAKYREDIEERWLEDNAGRYEATLAGLFSFLPRRADPAGEVYLTRAERRMEDIEVCEVAQPISVRIFPTTGAAAPQVVIEEGPKRFPSKPRKDGTLDIKFSTVGQKRVEVSSGGYIKSYTIYAVEPFRMEQQPDILQLLQKLTDFPPKWTDESFAQFRVKLEAVMIKLKAPEVFINGVIEYFFGLFLEDNQRPGFRERFQTSYGHLRWFIPYSDIARIICAQYLFCANEFAAAEKVCSHSSGRLQRTLCFFLDQPLPPKEPKESTGSKTRAGVALLVALPDLLTLQTVEAIGDNRLEDAVEICAAIRKQIIPAFSRERAARLDYVEARIKQADGEKSSAKTLFENLLHSPWEAIRHAAANQLN
jgi:hypothetical protein